MPRNDALQFDEAVTTITRTAVMKLRGDDGTEAVVQIVVTGPPELADEYLASQPITIEVFAAERYPQLREELLAQLPADDVVLAPPDTQRFPQPPDAAPNVLTIRMAVLEANTRLVAFRQVSDPPVPANCSHHYYFAAVEVYAALFNVVNNPDLELSYHNSVYYQYYTSGNWAVSYPSGGGQPSGDTHYWLLRVYGQGGQPCEYNVTNIFVSPVTVADNPYWRAIG